MLKIALCDDESQDRGLLKSIIDTQLSLCGLEYMISEFESGEEFIASITNQNKQFDLIFLDIEMKKLNGIETARHLRELDGTSIIVFITGYSDYVFDGYDVKALNYVLKPYKKEKILRVLEDALQQIDTARKRYFSFETANGIFKLNWNDILYFTSDKRKIKVYTVNGAHEFYGKLDDVETKLGIPFIRIHQRYLVNLCFVDAIDTKFVCIKNGKLPISRQEYQAVMITFAKYMLS